MIMVVMKIMMMTTLSSMMNSTMALHRAEAPSPGGARQELPPPDAANTSTSDLVRFRPGGSQVKHMN